MLYVSSFMTNFSSLTAIGEDIIADFNADANYDSDVDDNGDEQRRTGFSFWGGRTSAIHCG